MEKHLWSEEALISDIDIHHVVVQCLMHELLESRRLYHFAWCVCLFFVELLVFFQDVLAHVAILFFDFSCNLIGVFGSVLFASIFQVIFDILRYVAASQWNALDTARNDCSIADREHVSHTISWVNNCSSQILLVKVVNRSVFSFWASDLRV